MFRDDRQASQAIRLLLETVHLDDLWTPDGPTPEAVECYEARSPHSSGEELLVQIAFAFWGSHNTKASFARMLAVLDDIRLRDVFSLATAVATGSDAVDRWIEERQ